MAEDFHSFEDYSNSLKPISSEVIKGKLFVFEGLEIPGSNSGRLLFKKFNLKYNY